MSDTKLTVLIGNTGVSVWSDGKSYDPSTECYHPVYSYSIKTPDWEYVGNDIHGGANEIVDTHKGMQSLLAFLYACAEGYRREMSGASSENGSLFPPHVAEWAYQFDDEISVAAVDKLVANTLVQTTVSDSGDIFDQDESEFHHCPTCGNRCGVTDYSDGRCKDCHIMDAASEEDDGDHCPDCGNRCNVTDYSDGRCRDCTVDN